MVETVRVEGLQELEQKLLRDLPAATGFKVMRGAMVSAALPMMKAAKANVPKDTGALEESIGRFSKKGRVGDRVVTVFLGPKTENKKAVETAQKAGRNIKGIFYGLMVEKGYTTTGGKKVPPQPYLRPAFLETKNETVNLFAQKLAVSIEKAAKK